MSEHIGQIDVRNVAFTLDANGRQNHAFRSLRASASSALLPIPGSPLRTMTLLVPVRASARHDLITASS